FAFLQARFSAANIRATGSVTERIADLSGGYPDYVQRLGLELYFSVGGGGTITVEAVERAYEDMVLGLDGEFENCFNAFTPLEREILVALATGKTQPSEIAREVRKPIFNISKTLTTLMNHGVIERPIKAHYRITDPVFADWLNRRFKPVTET
ncbi:MAG: helix-turn-helix domain-containing protein, partial [Thermoprotei archaeon]